MRMTAPAYTFRLALVAVTGVTIFAPIGYFDWFFPSANAAGALLNDPHAQQDARNILGDIEKLFQILAYIVGAVWVYFNYLRGRTYRERLEPTISGELCRRSNPEMIRAVVRVKNVGLREVPIQQSGSGVRFLALDATDTTKWRHLTTKPVLQRHQWIEPGEMVEDHLLIATDLRHVPAVKLASSLFSMGNL